MAITESSVIQHGARVRVRRGRFPADPALLGREGTVVENSPYRPHKVEVTLDGEAEVRAFAPDEIEVLTGPAALPASDVESAKKRLSRP